MYGKRTTKKQAETIPTCWESRRRCSFRRSCDRRPRPRQS